MSFRERLQSVGFTDYEVTDEFLVKHIDEVTYKMWYNINCEHRSSFRKQPWNLFYHILHGNKNRLSDNIQMSFLYNHN